MLFGHFLKGLVTSGDLTILDAGRRAHRYGDGKPPRIVVRLHDPALHWKLFLRPDYYAGEAYTDGTLTVEEGSLYQFLEIVLCNAAAAGRSTKSPWLYRAEATLGLVTPSNRIGRAKQNAQHHYDLSSELYELFLDRDRQYSCAYFQRPNDDLETAQRRKCRHIAAKLLIRPGMRVLDIGCGWGGMALYLAERLEARVTGVTLAEEQLKVARARVNEAGLSDRIELFLRDYREETGTYDRIVSIGMFEHVGRSHYPTFFAALRDRLAEDGVALLHTIGHGSRPCPTNPWIRRHIFPGGHIPSLSEITQAIARSGLWITDIEVWRQHYAETLRHWRQRFLARRDQAKALYGDRFCRMWEFYLAGSEIAFRYMDECVYQIQLTRRMETLPILRDYMVDGERSLAAAERGRSRAA